MEEMEDLNEESGLSFKFKFEEFEGPLDALLELIAKNNMTIK